MPNETLAPQPEPDPGGPKSEPSERTSTETPTAAATERAEPRRLRADLFDALRQRLGRFFLLFGSAAAVSTFLLFAGFLSDFAVYRLAGLPRLSLNLTSLIESGAGVLIDTMALLVSSPWRIAGLVIGFLSLMLVWAHDKCGPVRRFTGSRAWYHTARLAALLLSFLILAGEIELVDRGIHPEEGRKARVEAALRRAYQAEVPTPRERQRELERLGYQIGFFPLPNWAEYLLDGASRTPRTDWEETVSGIPLRGLPESREAASHVFGWIMFSLVGLSFVVVLLPLWQRSLANSARAGRATGSGPQQRPPAGWPHLIATRVQGALPAWARPVWDSPFQYLVVPLTALFAVLSFAVLPLCHGLLARHSIGHETVLVLLRGDKHESGARQDDARPCMTYAWRTLSGPAIAYRRAVRNLIQARPSEERDHQAARDTAQTALATLVEAVVTANCPAALQTLWEERPAIGLAAADAELTEAFRHKSGVALEHYQGRLGTILTYPRDSEPLGLVESIQPRTPTSDGQWSLMAHARDKIQEIVVIPDVGARKARAYEELLVRQPDNDVLESLLTSLGPHAFAATLTLLRERRLYVQHAGVAVTAIGGMAFSNTSERPDLVTTAIDLLAQMSSTTDDAPTEGTGDAWPTEEHTNVLRGAAITALHLSRSPYAAARLASEIERTRDRACGQRSLGTPPAIQCLGQTITAAGFLLQDLVTEARLFGRKAPASLERPMTTLARYLVAVVASGERTDEHRATACSALVQSGIRALDEETGQKYLAAVRQMKPVDNFMAMPICVKVMSSMRFGHEGQRVFLRDLVLAPPGTGSGQEPVERVRMTSLIVLAELGLAAESDFLFKAFTTSGKAQRQFISRFLDEADGAGLGKLFTDCAMSNIESDEVAAIICMDGLLGVDTIFDGDEGATRQISTLLTSNQKGDVRAKACKVLRTFEQRGGKLAQRMLDPDDGELAKACPPSEEVNDNKMRQLRELLEGLGKERSDTQ